MELPYRREDPVGKEDLSSQKKAKTGSLVSPPSAVKDNGHSHTADYAAILQNKYPIISSNDIIKASFRKFSSNRKEFLNVYSSADLRDYLTKRAQLERIFPTVEKFLLEGNVYGKMHSNLKMALTNGGIPLNVVGKLLESVCSPRKFWNLLKDEIAQYPNFNVAFLSLSLGLPLPKEDNQDVIRELNEVLGGISNNPNEVIQEPGTFHDVLAREQDNGLVENRGTHKSLQSISTQGATTVSNSEKARFSRKRESNEPVKATDEQSIIASAKSAYLSSDHTRVREILSILDHHLSVSPETKRLKAFGFAISLYRQKTYKESYNYFTQLEELALEHDSRGDVSVAAIYRGEIFIATKDYKNAVTMFEKGCSFYHSDHVAILLGVLIVSKSGILMKLGNCHKSLSNFEKARECMERAVELAQEVRKDALEMEESDPKRSSKVSQSTAECISALHSIGNLLSSEANYADALPYYKKALDLQNKESDNLAVCWAKGNYGNALLGVNRCEESIVYLEEAFALATKYERSPSGICRAASNLGNAYLAMNMHHKAQEYFKMAHGHAVYSNDEAGQAKALSNIGNALSHQGDHFEALKCFNEALSDMSCSDEVKMLLIQNRGQLYFMLANKCSELGDEWEVVPEGVNPEEPEEFQEKVYFMPEEEKAIPSQLSCVLVPPAALKSTSGLDDMKEMEVEKGLASQAKPVMGKREIVQATLLPKAVRFGARISSRLFYLLKAKEDYNLLLDFIRSKVNSHDEISKSFQEALSKSYCCLQHIHILLRDTGKALQMAEENRAVRLGGIIEQKNKSHDLSLQSIVKPLNLEGIKKFVQKENSIVVVLSSIASSMIVHILFPSSLEKGEGVIHHFLRIPLPNHLFNDLRGKETKFEDYVTKDLIEFLNQNEIDLFQPISLEAKETPLCLLFREFAKKFVQIIEEKAPAARDIVIIPDKATHLLPWAMLQYEAGEFLGDRYRIRLFPSILIMGIINSTPLCQIMLPSAERFLVVGNPAIPRVVHNGREISLGRLPHAEEEAIKVAHILETTPLLREHATKQSIVYRLQSANIVHIATHGSSIHGYLAFSSSTPSTTRFSNSTVEAKEALLFSEEIRNLDVNAALVVLSACDSGRGQIIGEEVHSIAQSFLAAGAQSVLLSLVRVPDKSASIFMELFYRFLSHDSIPTSVALQKSSMGVRCIKSLTQHVHWGGFQLIGRNITINYDQTCSSAKVDKLLGGSSPFPRLKMVGEIEFSIFRQDREPPRDVVLVCGMSGHDPSEAVRDFIHKHFQYYPAGVCWYNCATPETLDASIKTVEYISRLHPELQKAPPMEPGKPVRRSKFLESSIGKLLQCHHKLVILDHPSDLDAIVARIPDIRQAHTDIIVISDHQMLQNDSFVRKVDAKILRGCSKVEVGYLDTYSATQRMAYSLLLSVDDFSPYSQDVEAFEVISKFCSGNAVLVNVLQGMLGSSKGEEGSFSLRRLADEIIQMQKLAYYETCVDDAPNTQAPIKIDTKQTSTKKSSKKAPFSFAKRAESPQQGKPCQPSDPKMDVQSKCLHVMWSNFLTHKLLTYERFLLEVLSYISLYPNRNSEATLSFPDTMVTSLANCISGAFPESKGGFTIVEKLKKLRLLLEYPSPVLFPLSDPLPVKLLYIPDFVARILTSDLDETDRDFIQNVIDTVLQNRIQTLQDSNLGYLSYYEDCLVKTFNNILEL